MYTWLAALLLICLQLQAICRQHELDKPETFLKGNPGIVHYSRHDFNADPQFWTVCEDNNGIVYFGNNDGAVIFDGEHWYQISLPNNSSIRSLVADSLGNVYAGGFNEFGLIKKNNKGHYYYTSLNDSLKISDPKIGNLWQVHIVNGTVIYRSFNKLITINGQQITKLPATSYFIRSYLINGHYYVQDQSEGIFKLDLNNMTFEKYFTTNQLKNEEIISMLPSNAYHRVLGISKSGKIFFLDLKNRKVKLHKKLFNASGINQVNCAVAAKDGVYYLGTLSTGIITLSKNGDVLKDDKDFIDLQDNSVLNLHQTHQGNIWAVLNNGLDCIILNSPVTAIFKNASLYDVLIRQNEMYLATNQGIFFADSVNNNKLNFQKVTGLEGQGWSLQNIEGDILVGHDKGLYMLDKTISKKISASSGFWKVIPIAERGDIYLAAQYSGLFVIEKKENGQWRVLRRIEGFDESTRDILETDIPGTFWVCHGYKGVYRIKMDESYSRVVSYEHYTTQNGLDYPYNINAARWEGQIVFTTNQGIYTYDRHKNRFMPYEKLNKILDPSKNTRRLFQHQDKTWFIQDDEAGYFITGDPHHVLEKDFFLQFKGAFNRGMECITPINNDQVMLGTKTGLYLFDLTYKAGHTAHTLLTGISYAINNKEKPLVINPEKSFSLPNNTSSLRFDYAAPEMQNAADIQYSYKLESVDEKWSDWDFTSFKEYAHLRPGNYTFKVKSRSMLGTMGTMASFQFKILPMWYQTKWAIMAYITLAITIIVLIIKFVNKKIAKENLKAREEERKAKKLLELELTQLKLKAEKDKIRRDKLLLEQDVIYKSKELANYTMLLVKKKEIFREIREDIKELRRLVRNEGSRKKLQNMFSKLNQHEIGEEYMSVFDANFEKVHQHFFKSLKEICPELTQRELRICAFIKMNLTNKEISPLLNISVRGIETARYRIRKKLNLEHEDNFADFLENLKEGYRQN